MLSAKVQCHMPQQDPTRTHCLLKPLQASKSVAHSAVHHVPSKNCTVSLKCDMNSGTRADDERTADDQREMCCCSIMPYTDFTSKTKALSVRFSAIKQCGGIILWSGIRGRITLRVRSMQVTNQIAVFVCPTIKREISDHQLFGPSNLDTINFWQLSN